MMEKCACVRLCMGVYGVSILIHGYMYVYLLSSIQRRAGSAFRLITSWVWASSPVTMLPTVRRAGREKRGGGVR
jgi:hypothetical protein